MALKSICLCLIVSCTLGSAAYGAENRERGGLARSGGILPRYVTQQEAKHRALVEHKSEVEHTEQSYVSAVSPRIQNGDRQDDPVREIPNAPAGGQNSLPVVDAETPATAALSPAAVPRVEERPIQTQAPAAGNTRLIIYYEGNPPGDTDQFVAETLPGLVAAKVLPAEWANVAPSEIYWRHAPSLEANHPLETPRQRDAADHAYWDSPLAAGDSRFVFSLTGYQQSQDRRGTFAAEQNIFYLESSGQNLMLRDAVKTFRQGSSGPSFSTPPAPFRISSFSTPPARAQGSSGFAPASSPERSRTSTDAGELLNARRLGDFGRPVSMRSIVPLARMPRNVPAEASVNVRPLNADGLRPRTAHPETGSFTVHEALQAAAPLADVFAKVMKAVDQLQKLLGLDLKIVRTILEALAALHENASQEILQALRPYYDQLYALLAPVADALGFALSAPPQREAQKVGEAEERWMKDVDTFVTLLLAVQSEPAYNEGIRASIVQALREQQKLYAEIVAPVKASVQRKTAGTFLKYLMELRAYVRQRPDVLIQKNRDGLDMLMNVKTEPRSQ